MQFNAIKQRKSMVQKLFQRTGKEKNKNLPKVTLQTEIKTKELSKSIIGKNSQASVTQIERSKN